MNVKQQYKGTLESMMVAFENSPLAEMEESLSKDIDTQTADNRSDLLDIICSGLESQAEELIGNIEYINKVEAYKCGFRRAIHIMLDTFFGGESNE